MECKWLFMTRRKLKALSMNDIFKLVDFLGGEPVYTNFGFIAKLYVTTAQGKDLKNYTSMKTLA